NELLPRLVVCLDRASFAGLKRRIVTEMASITAILHRARVFHRDLYLCHFFLDAEGTATESKKLNLSLIDLHRLQEHQYLGDWWRWKDLGQLLFSTEGVAGISVRDQVRFWKSYCQLAGIKRPWLHARMVRLRAARYGAHNRKRQQTRAHNRGKSLK